MNQVLGFYFIPSIPAIKTSISSIRQTFLSSIPEMLRNRSRDMVPAGGFAEKKKCFKYTLRGDSNPRFQCFFFFVFGL
jgi:hypothetical protein